MNDPTPLRMMVLGSGSVGLAIAASFAQAGQSVTLPARGSAVPLLRERGITVTGVCGHHRIGPNRLRVCDADEPDPQDIACDVLIVATKACQVAEVLKCLMRTAEVAIDAITRMTYGELVSNEHARHLITRVADETIRVILDQRRLALAADGATYVEKTPTPFVLPKAAAHRSSMLQDVEAGRRTEIDCLNGAVVRMGQGRGIATAGKDAVANLVRARETGVVVPARA